MPRNPHDELRDAIGVSGWWIIPDGETAHLWTRPNPEGVWHLHGVVTRTPLTASALRATRLGGCPTPSALRGAHLRGDAAAAAAELTISRHQPDFLTFSLWRQLATSITERLAAGDPPPEAARAALAAAGISRANMSDFDTYTRQVGEPSSTVAFEARRPGETPTGYYRRVAEMFKAAEQVDPKAPVGYLAEQLGVPFHKAVRHVNEARNRGLLELSEQQKRNRVGEEPGRNVGKG